MVINITINKILVFTIQSSINYEVSIFIKFILKGDHKQK